jgi:hypothetical protein
MKKTKKERRIAVLKDAVKQIKLNNIIGSTGDVVKINIRELDPCTPKNSEVEAKPLLTEFFKKKGAKVCNVCARGALLVCTVHKENDFLLSDFENIVGAFDKNSSVDIRLMKLFSEKQLILMENAFEISNYLSDLENDSLITIDFDEIDVDYTSYSINSNEGLTEREMEKTILFGSKYENDSDRLLAIFNNAIKNGGIFKP